MLSRKINAGLSLLVTVLLLDHAVFLSVWMLSRCSIAKSCEFLPWVLMGLTVLHALISIDQAISAHSDTKARKGNAYPKLNLPTILQRISGIFMALMLALHVTGAANHFQPKLLHAVVHPLFFGAVLAHVAFSASKALITLGIGSAGLIKVVDVIVKILCAAAFAAGVIGFYLCLFMGVAK